MITASLIAAVGLAMIHLLSSNLRFLDTIPRSRWLSLSGGVAVAYAIVHLLPELQANAPIIEKWGGNRSVVDERSIYAVALLGLIGFYGLERSAQQRSSTASDGQAAGQRLFWLHIASYGSYNGLIGYLLVQEDRNTVELLLYFVAIGLHFLVNDHGLQQHHQQRYRRIGRWLLSGAILIGCIAGLFTRFPPFVTAAVTALLSGGILLNTFKEELPAERESRFWAFALGAVLYAGVLLSID